MKRICDIIPVLPKQEKHANHDHHGHSCLYRFSKNSVHLCLLRSECLWWLFYLISLHVML